MFHAIEARLIFHDGGIGTAKIAAERSKSFCTHIKKVKKNPNDRMPDKSGEFFLKPCVFKVYITVHTGGFCFVPGRFLVGSGRFLMGSGQFCWFSF